MWLVYGRFEQPSEAEGAVFIVLKSRVNSKEYPKPGDLFGRRGSFLEIAAKFFFRNGEGLCAYFGLF